MCGINGILSFNKSISIIDRLEKMNLMIYHRGPDEDGFYFDELIEYKIGLAMRRLSIIDIKTGEQPIYSEDRTKIIVFNGEIYNYQILKECLLNKGCVFNTNSDTETNTNNFNKKRRINEHTKVSQIKKYKSTEELLEEEYIENKSINKLQDVLQFSCQTKQNVYIL